MSTTSSRRSSVVFGWFVCALGALFYCYEYFLRVAPSIMEESLRNTYHLNALGYGNLLATYYFLYTPMQLIVGVLIDRYGPRRLLFFACMVCALGAYLFASSHYLSITILGRACIGLGSAFAFVGVLKLATLWLPSNRLAFISGLTTTLGMIGAVYSDKLLPKIIQHFSWQTTSYLAAITGAILAFVLLIFIDEQPEAEMPAQIYFKELLSGLLTLIKKPQMWIVGMIGCFLFVSASAIAESWGIPFIQHAYNIPLTQAASLITYVFWGWIIGSPFAGWLSDKMQKRVLPLVLGSLLTLTVLLLLRYLPLLHPHLLKILLFFVGFFSSVEIIIFAIAREICPPQLAGTAMALTNFFVMVNGMVLQPAMGKLLDFFSNGIVEHGLRVYSAANYKEAFMVLPLAYLMAFILSKFFLQESYR